MTTYYTCTEVTSEVYAAYVKYCPSNALYSFEGMWAVTLCYGYYEEITIFPVRPYLNERHLEEFGSTDPQSCDGDINILVSVEEFFNQLFMFELEQ